MNATIYSFEDFQVDPQRRLVLRGGVTVPLTSKAFDLLLALIEAGGREVTKDALMERVWPDQFVEEANLTVTMSQLRKALGEKPNEHRLIVTIPGVGYRFVGQPASSASAPIHRHAVADIVSGNGSNNEGKHSIAEQATPGFSPAVTSGRPLAARPGGRSRLVWIPIAAAVVVIAAGGIVAAVLLFNYLKRPPVVLPFRNVKLTRLTNTGKVAAAAISPDGKYLAYAERGKDGNSLLVQQVGTASIIKILAPQPGEFWGLTYTPDGRFIYYTLFFADRTDPELYRVPSLGGAAFRIPDIAPISITFSPDGRQFAYAMPNSAVKAVSLLIADADGRKVRVVARKPEPNTFAIEGKVTSWSPDGKTIACVLNQFEHDSSFSTILGIDPTNGTETILSPRHWWEVENIEWLKSGAGVIVAAKEKPFAESQLWLIPYPSGEPYPLSLDVNEYFWVSSPLQGDSFIAVQTNSASRILLGEPAGGESDFHELLSEVGALNPLAWTADGKLAYRSNADGSGNLWIMEADGSGRRQLTDSANASELGVCTTPVGTQIVFVAWISGRSNLWRIDADGRNLTQLTDGDADAYPRCTPDGKSIVFQRGISADQRLFRVPLGGGQPRQVVDMRAKWPALSHDGNRVAFFHMAEDRWKIGIVSVSGGPLLQDIVVPASLLGRPIYWAPDDRSIRYISTVGNVGNVWTLPLDGRDPSAVTTFTADRLEDFTLTPDGKRLAVVRNKVLSDVVQVTSTP